MTQTKPFIGTRQFLAVYSHGGEYLPEMTFERGPMSKTQALAHFLNFDSGQHQAFIVEMAPNGEADLITERPYPISEELCEQWIAEAFALLDAAPPHVPDFIMQHAPRDYERAHEDWAEERDTYSYSPWQKEHRLGGFEYGLRGAR